MTNASNGSSTGTSGSTCSDFFHVAEGRLWWRPRIGRRTDLGGRDSRAGARTREPRFDRGGSLGRRFDMAASTFDGLGASRALREAGIPPEHAYVIAAQIQKMARAH